MTLAGCRRDRTRRDSSTFMPWPKAASQGCNPGMARRRKGRKVRKAHRGRSHSPDRSEPNSRAALSPKKETSLSKGSPASPLPRRGGREGGRAGKRRRRRGRGRLGEEEEEGRGGGGGPARPRRLLIDSQLSAPPSHKLSRRRGWLCARPALCAAPEPSALPAFLPCPPARPGPGPAPALRPAQPLRSTEQVSAPREQTPSPPSSASSSSSCSPSFLPARRLPQPRGWRGAQGSHQPPPGGQLCASLHGVCVL